MPKKFSLEEKQQIEDTILREYKRVLVENPDSKISVNDLVQKAKIAKGTFYLFFPDKEALFLRIIADILEEVSFLIREKAEQNTDSLDFLVEVIIGFSSLVETHKWLINASGREFSIAQSQLSDEGKNYIATRKTQLWEQFISRLDKDLKVSKEKAIDIISILLFSNTYQETLFDFESSYRHLANIIGENILKKEKKNE